MSHLLVKDENRFIPSRGNNAIALSLDECLKRKLLISPDTREIILLSKNGNLCDGKMTYALKNNSPVLYPKEILDISQDCVLPMTFPTSALQQYVLLSQIKQSGEINAPLDSNPARKHQYRLSKFCKGLSGLILDIGSDRPSHSTQLLPPNCEYLGLDPYAGHGEFRIIGLGEILPINDTSVDVVLFNTSLDHILDYHTAIDEAHRVLKPGGKIVIATYVWRERATLITDSVHFHHFREFEILGSLERHFEVEDVVRYEDPKHDTHRYGLYVIAKQRIDNNQAEI